jgi:hypothetical protein
MADDEKKSSFMENMEESLKNALASALKPTDKIHWQCNCSGSCCLGTDVLLYPYDVWQLAQSPALAGAGIDSTVKLFKGEPPLLDLFLGHASRIPVASIHHAPFGGNGPMACPFLAPAFERTPGKPRLLKTVDDKPTLLCGVHANRPTICRSYPHGRMVQQDPKTGAVLDVLIADNRDQCKRCYVDSDKGPEQTVAEFLEKSGTAEGYKQNDRWTALWPVLSEIKTDQLRWMVGQMAYNFDAPSVSKGLEGREIAWRRPKTYEEHIARVEQFVRAFAARDTEAIIAATASFTTAGAAAIDAAARKSGLR